MTDTIQNAQDYVSAKAAGKALGVDAKAIRRFMRRYAEKHDLETPGRGGEWRIPAPNGDLTKFAQAFSAGVGANSSQIVMFDFVDDEILPDEPGDADDIVENDE